MKNNRAFNIITLFGLIISFLMTFQIFYCGEDNSPQIVNASSSTFTFTSNSTQLTSTECNFLELEPNDTCSSAQELSFVNNIANITGIANTVDSTNWNKDYFTFIASSNQIDVSLILNQPCGSCSGTSEIAVILYEQSACPTFSNYVKFSYITCDNPSASFSAIVTTGERYYLLVIPQANNSFSDYTLDISYKTFIPGLGESCNLPIVLQTGTNNISNLSSAVLDVMNSTLASCYASYSSTNNVDTVFQITLSASNDMISIKIPKSINNRLIAVLVDDCLSPTSVNLKGCVSDYSNTEMTLLCPNLSSGIYYLVISKAYSSAVWPDTATTYIYVKQSVTPTCNSSGNDYNETNDVNNDFVINGTRIGTSYAENTNLNISMSNVITIGGCFNLHLTSNYFGYYDGDVFSFTNSNAPFLTVSISSDITEQTDYACWIYTGTNTYVGGTYNINTFPFQISFVGTSNTKYSLLIGNKIIGQVGQYWATIQYHTPSSCTPLAVGNYIESSDSSNTWDAGTGTSFTISNAEITNITLSSTSPQIINGCYKDYSISSLGYSDCDTYRFNSGTSSFFQLTISTNAPANNTAIVFFDSTGNPVNFWNPPSSFPFQKYIGELIHGSNYYIGVGNTLLSDEMNYTISLVSAQLTQIPGASSCNQVSASNNATSFPVAFVGYTHYSGSPEQWWSMIADTSGIYYFDFNGGQAGSGCGFGPYLVGSLLQGSCSGTELSSINNGWKVGLCDSNYSSQNWTGTASLVAGNKYYIKACDSYSSMGGDCGKINVIVYK